MPTTIQISDELRDELKAMGKKGETYEDIIRRLKACCEEKEKEE